MIGIYGNKQTMPESQKKELFSAGITYMVSGEYAFAFSCFTQAGKSDLPTLYNKALCCYYLSLYNDCRSLLLEAERLLPPEEHNRYLYQRCRFPAPVPEDRAMEAAIQQYAFCPDMDQSCDGIGSLADTLRQSRIWYFWWD